MYHVDVEEHIVKKEKEEKEEERRRKRRRKRRGKRERGEKRLIGSILAGPSPDEKESLSLSLTHYSK